MGGLQFVHHFLNWSENIFEIGGGNIFQICGNIFAYWWENIFVWSKMDVGAKKLWNSHLLPRVHEIGFESEDSLRKLQPPYLNHPSLGGWVGYSCVDIERVKLLIQTKDVNLEKN